MDMEGFALLHALITVCARVYFLIDKNVQIIILVTIACDSEVHGVVKYFAFHCVVGMLASETLTRCRCWRYYSNLH